MSKSFMRYWAALAMVAALAGCSSSQTANVLSPGGEPAVDNVTQAPVVQGACPKVSLREGTAYFNTYAKGGDKDPAQIVHQAAISQTTRQCRTDGQNMTMTVQASGRVVAGPKGGPGDVTLPVRVVVLDGETVLYSELQKQTVTLPAGEPTTQFLFTNSTVTFPVAASRTAQVQVGFDPGPYNTP